MTDSQIFYRLFSGGNHARPFLLEFYKDEESVPLRFVNNNQNIVFEDNEFIASSFTYNEPDRQGDGASLTISGHESGLIEFIEESTSKWFLKVAGVIAEDGTIQKISQYIHFYGTVSYSDNMELEFELGRDDRPDMTFPPYTFDTENNIGNA